MFRRHPVVYVHAHKTEFARQVLAEGCLHGWLITQTKASTMYRHVERAAPAGRLYRRVDFDRNLCAISDCDLIITFLRRRVDGLFQAGKLRQEGGKPFADFEYCFQMTSVHERSHWSDLLNPLQVIIFKRILQQLTVSQSGWCLPIEYHSSAAIS